MRRSGAARAGEYLLGRQDRRPELVRLICDARNLLESVLRPFDEDVMRRATEPAPGVSEDDRLDGRLVVPCREVDRIVGSLLPTLLLPTEGQPGFLETDDVGSASSCSRRPAGSCGAVSYPDGLAGIEIAYPRARRASVTSRRVWRMRQTSTTSSATT